MKILYSDQNYCDLNIDFSNSIFLCGPTPRDKNVISWRPEAISILEKLNFSGTVLVPERHDFSIKFDYVDQVEWEEFGLNNASKLLFWVPRKFPDMKALTTNIEFGIYITKSPQKVFYGRPEDSESNRYLDYKYKKITNRNPCKTLLETIEKALL